MEKIFNVILIIGLLVTLYFCIQKYKKDHGLISISDKQNIVSEENSTKQPLSKANNKELVEKFNMDKIYPIETEPDQTIKFNYEELKNICDSIQGKFMLTINDSPYIRELFSNYELKEINVSSRWARCNKKKSIRKELIIMN